MAFKWFIYNRGSRKLLKYKDRGIYRTFNITISLEVFNDYYFYILLITLIIYIFLSRRRASFIRGNYYIIIIITLILDIFISDIIFRI